MLNLIAQAQAQSQFGPGLQPPTGAFSTGSNEASGAGAAANLEMLVSNLVGILTTVGSIAFVLYFVLGAFNWITAGGDKGKIEKARSQMTMGILGLVILVASYSIIGLIGTVLGLDILNPGQVILQQLNPNPTGTPWET